MEPQAYFSLSSCCRFENSHKICIIYSRTGCSLPRLEAEITRSFSFARACITSSSEGGRLVAWAGLYQHANFRRTHGACWP